MDIREGHILNWPLGPDWETNAPVIEAMLATWKAWLFFSRTTNPKHTKWESWEVAYSDWLDEGRERLPSAPSAAEEWAIAQGLIDG